MRLFGLHVSRTTAISSASTVARLTKNVSEAVSFAPTKIAAEIILQILETIKKVDDNDDAHIKLMNRVIDYLLILRNHSEASPGSLSPNLAEKIQEFEETLLSIHRDLLKAGKKSFKQRVFSKDKIKSDLDAHTAAIEFEIEKLKLMLHLDTNMVVRTRIAHLNVESQLENMDERSLVLRQPAMSDPGEEFWEELRSNYKEVPVGDIDLERPVFENAAVSFADFSYARVGGKRYLVKRFNGEDEEEIQAWLQELKYGRKLRRHNILQMQGFSRKNNPNLYVIFQNKQVRCLATYVLDLLTGSRNIPSIASEFIKMTNSALDAIRYSANAFCMNEATSVLLARKAQFALDPGNNLIVYPNPRRTRNRITRSLLDVLVSIIWPPDRNSRMDHYLTGLTATKITLGSIGRSISERRAAVMTFLINNWYQDEFTGNLMLDPMSRSSLEQSPTLSALIDYRSEVRPGDYGILVPGQKQDFSFQAYGNVVKDSSGIISTTPSQSWLYSFTSGTYADEVQDSPRIWSIDANRARLEGFYEFETSWRRFAELVDSSRASRFLVNSIPLLPRVESFEDIILVAGVSDFKDYRFLIQDPDSLEPDNENNVTPISPLPTIYAREPDSTEDELEFSQCSPNVCPRVCEHLDSRIHDVKNIGNVKVLHYTRVRKEDLFKRFGFIPAVRKKKREPCNAGPIIRSNRCGWFNSREYELVVQRNKPWCEATVVPGEYP